jgi:hypothetical protein
MKKILALIIFSISLPAYCEVSQEDYCFSPVGGNASRFELRTYFDDSVKWSGAFVKYEKSKELIPLVLADFKEDPTTEGRPSELTAKWLEVSKGAITGEYEMVSQGGNIESMSYKNYRSQKTYDFEFDINAKPTKGMGCDW